MFESLAHRLLEVGCCPNVPPAARPAVQEIACKGRKAAEEAEAAWAKQQKLGAETGSRLEDGEAGEEQI